MHPAQNRPIAESRERVNRFKPNFGSVLSGVHMFIFSHYAIACQSKLRNRRSISKFSD